MKTLVELTMNDIVPKEVVFERKANYYETDQMGIVHHSKLYPLGLKKPVFIIWKL